MAAFLFAGIVTPVSEQGEGLDDGALAVLILGGQLLHHREEFQKFGIGPFGEAAGGKLKQVLAAGILKVLFHLGRQLLEPLRGHFREVALPGVLEPGHGLGVAEFVVAGQDLFAVPALQGKGKGAAVGVAATPGVPVHVRHRAEAGVFLGQAGQRRVDGLLLRAHQADLHFPFGQRKNLGPEHAGVGDADELEFVFGGVVPGDDEEPGAVRRAVDVGGLDLPVDALLLRRQAIEVPLRGGGQGLDDVLQGIAVKPVPQVEEQHRHFGVREELGVELALAQILADRMIVGKVTVVHQGVVERR